MSCTGDSKLKISITCPCDVSNPRSINFSIPESCGSDFPQQEFFDGEQSSIVLEKHDELTPKDQYDGDTLAIEQFHAFKPEDIVAVDDGDAVEIFLHTTSLVSSDNHSGDDFVFELRTFPVVVLELEETRDGDGEAVGSQYEYTGKWYKYWPGESFAINYVLSFRTQIGVPTNIFDGENIAITNLQYPKAVNFEPKDLYDGSYTENILHTIVNIAPEVSVIDGERSTINNMVLAKWASIDSNVLDGENSSATLSVIASQNSFAVAFLDGENSVSDILKSKPNPLTGVSFSSIDGDGTAHIFKTESILTFSDVDGSTSTIDEVQFDYSKFERFYDGEMTPLFALRATSLLNPNVFSHGEYARIDFKSSPPPEFRPYVFDDGDNVWFTVDRLKTVICRPYNIVDDAWVSCELENVSRNFALCKACAPIMACDTVIEFDRYPVLWEHSDDIKEKFEVSLSVEKRLSVEFADGESGTVRLFERNNPIGPFEFFDGDTQRNALWWDKSLDFDNTSSIIDGGKADIDLSQDGPGRKESRAAYDGDRVETLLETIQACRFRISDGENVAMDLDIWKWPGFYDGEFVQNGLATDVKLYVNIIDGDEFIGKFPEPDNEMTDGEYVSMELKIVYDVYFKEFGCVDNEYIPKDSNGEPLYHLRTTAAIEFEPFEYSLRGGCY